MNESTYIHTYINIYVFMYKVIIAHLQHVKFCFYLLYNNNYNNKYYYYNY